MSRHVNGESPWLETRRPVPLGHLLMACQKLKIDIHKAATRLAAYGFDVVAIDGLPDAPTDDDLIILGQDTESEFSWLYPGATVPRHHLLKAASLLEIGTHQVANRLTAYGFDVPSVDELPQQPAHDDCVLISAELDGRGPWLDPKNAIPIGHIVAVAQKTGLSIGEAADQLSAYGFAVPQVDGVPRLLDKLDHQMLSQDLDGTAPWVASGSVPLPHLIVTIRQFGITVAEAINRFAAYGFDTPPIGDVPRALTDIDYRLLSRDFDGESPWRGPSQPVELSRLIQAMRRFRIPLGDVVNRFKTMGLNVPDPAELVCNALARIPQPAAPA